MKRKITTQLIRWMFESDPKINKGARLHNFDFVDWSRQSQWQQKLMGQKIDCYRSSRVVFYPSARFFRSCAQLDRTFIVGPRWRRSRRSTKRNRERHSRKNKQIWHEILCWINFHPFCSFLCVECVRPKSVSLTLWLWRMRISAIAIPPTNSRIYYFGFSVWNIMICIELI